MACFWSANADVSQSLHDHPRQQRQRCQTTHHPRWAKQSESLPCNHAILHASATYLFFQVHQSMDFKPVHWETVCVYTQVIVIWYLYILYVYIHVDSYRCMTCNMYRYVHICMEKSVIGWNILSINFHLFDRIVLTYLDALHIMYIHYVTCYIE